MEKIGKFQKKIGVFTIPKTKILLKLKKLIKNGILGAAKNCLNSPEIHIIQSQQI